jgi:hypothetical protein
VIHRERVVPVAERVEQHMAQRVVEPTVHTHEVVYDNAPLQQGAMPMAQQSNLQPQAEKKHGLLHRQ